MGLLDQIEIFWFSGTKLFEDLPSKRNASERILREAENSGSILSAFKMEKKIAPMIWRKESLRLDKLGWERERHKLSINSIIEFSFGNISFKR